MSWSTELFQTSKPIIGLLHLDPLPGDPFYKGSMEQIIENATHDLKALQNGGVDGVLMTNEFSGPFFTDTPKPVFGAMCRIFGEIRHLFTVPYGVETIADGEGCVEICAATGASFTRCLFTGAWAGDTGLQQRNIARTLRLRRELDLDDLKLCYFINGEGTTAMDCRPLAQKAKSLLNGCHAECLVVSGPGPGSQPDVSQIVEVKQVAGDTPVFCGTGCNETNCDAILAAADGAFVGSAFKKDGVFTGRIDEERVARFMQKAKALRKD